MTLDYEITLSDDGKRATVEVRTMKGPYTEKLTGNEQVWSLRRKEIPGGYVVKYRNEPDGTLHDIRVE